MLETLRHRVATWLVGRSYLAAAGGRRWSCQPTMRSPVSAINAGRAVIAARARFAVGSNPLAASGAEAWVSALVGTGIKPQSQHPNKSVRTKLHKAWTAWTDVADADGLVDLYGLEATMARRLVVDGESFALLLNTAAGLRIRIIDPEQVDPAYTANLTGGGYVIQGIEFNAAGERVAYHVFSRPTGIETTLARDRKRIPVQDMVHIFKPEFAGQVRGMSWFAPVLLRMADLDQWRDAQLVRQKVAAMLAGFIEQPDGTGSPMDGEQQGNTLTGGLEPGTLKYLGFGEKITFSTPANIGMEVIQFAGITEREIAVGLGLPASTLTGDLSQVNYSSIRAGLVDFRRRCEAIQHSVLVFQGLRPIWNRWAAGEVLAGRIASSVEKVEAAIWVAPKNQWVDPKKDIEAELAAIAGGLMSRREAVASRGIDIEALDDEIAADNARAKLLGLTFGAPPTPANDNIPAAEAA